MKNDNLIFLSDYELAIVIAAVSAYSAGDNEHIRNVLDTLIAQQPKPKEPK